MQGSGQTSPAAYQILAARGLLADRVNAARNLLHACTLCGRRCQTDRTKGTGECRIGRRARLASYGPHHGEERVLKGLRGSGTVFFSGCNLHCVFCQNSYISQSAAGLEVEPGELAEVMLWLQSHGCHNINLVSPTHVVPMILEALQIAAEAGLRLPLVYNSGGFDSPETLRLLDGIVDIYMPDMKYSQVAPAAQYSDARNYPEVNQAAVREMHRQVGDLEVDESGLAVRGLLVRHLVLPDSLAGTPEIVRFLAEEISPNTALNLMDQYRPAFRAHDFEPLNRRLSTAEYRAAVSLAEAAGLTRLALCTDSWLLH
jgi:putative pyruvate formate lyase activating enzyme